VNVAFFGGQQVTVSAADNFNSFFHNNSAQTEVRIQDIENIETKTNQLAFTSGAVNAAVAGNVTVGGYAANQDPFHLIKIGTFDGISSDKLFSALLSLINGKASVANNPDGVTETWTFFKRDDASTAFTVIRNKNTSARDNKGTI
jgi:hypothetical protein